VATRAATTSRSTTAHPLHQRPFGLAPHNLKVFVTAWRRGDDAHAAGWLAIQQEAPVSQDLHYEDRWRPIEIRLGRHLVKVKTQAAVSPPTARPLRDAAGTAPPGRCRSRSSLSQSRPNRKARAHLVRTDRRATCSLVGQALLSPRLAGWAPPDLVSHGPRAFPSSPWALPRHYGTGGSTGRWYRERVDRALGG
jgi:hypothetical protein